MLRSLEATMAARETENLIVENAVAATVSAPRILVVEDNALIAMDLESIAQNVDAKSSDRLPR